MHSRLNHLQNMLKSSPNDGFLLFAIAKEHEKTNDLEGALAHYNTLEDTDSNYIGLYYHKGKLLERLQQIGAAIETYKKGIDLAVKAGDQHSANELRGALMEWEE